MVISSSDPGCPDDLGLTPLDVPALPVDLASLRGLGYFGTDSAVARVVERLGIPGSEDYPRVLEASVGGGFRFEVLPSRGFDIGVLEYAGVPLAWLSPVSDARALDVPTGSNWLSRFNGGFVATCGLRHFGQPSGSDALHGDIGHLPARRIMHKAQSSEPRIELRAEVNSAALFAPSLGLDRCITSGLNVDGLPYIQIDDIIANHGPEPFAPRLMYHLNFGAPLVAPGTTVEVPVSLHPGVDEGGIQTSSYVMPGISDGVGESVVEYPRPEIDPEGWAHCRIAAPSGLAVEVAWRADTLPHVHRWSLTGRNRWALAIEPASAPLMVTPDDRELPKMRAGDVRHFAVRLRVLSRPRPV